MRYGILGCAHGHVFGFCEQMQAAGGVLAGILQDGTENAAVLAERFHAPLVQSPQELFSQNIQLAGTFSPSFQRIEMMRLCEEQGVHVMSDKPLAVSEAALRELEGILQRGRIEVGAMFTVRFLPAVQGLYTLLQSGELGGLISMEIFNPHKLTPEKRPPWHFDPRQGGGIAADLFTHSIDLFYWLTGRKQAQIQSACMFKTILPEYPEFYDLAAASLCTGRVNGYFRVDWHMSEGHWSWGDIRIFCTCQRGCAEVRATGDPLTRREELIVYAPGGKTESRPLFSCSENEVTDLLKRVEGKKHSIRTGDILYTTRQALALEQLAARHSLINKEQPAENL